MDRLYYGYSKFSQAKGFVYALNCNNMFFVITQKTYENIRQKLNTSDPVFHTDIPVYIEGVNI